MSKIIKLDSKVVDRIAAGEVIQRPCNAIKELIENCLDANSTSISVTVDHGGLNLIQIVDNGTGIDVNDLEIVCQRFTTSKLKTFDDLATISTFGFRGEALASISHVSHLSILSKTNGNACGYLTRYLDGCRDGLSKAVAANQGTQVSIRDLFYNVPTRRSALSKSAKDEFQRISDLIGKYAIHNSRKCAFSLKRLDGGLSCDGDGIRTQLKSDVSENISLLHGSSIGKELVEVDHYDSSSHNDEKYLKFSFKAWISHPNSNTTSRKKFVFILFINNRLVDCCVLKRTVSTVYGAYLSKNSHPFVYMSVQIEPRMLDVNVHPTKHEVMFLNQDQIVSVIQREVELKLKSCNESRIFNPPKLSIHEDCGDNKDLIPLDDIIKRDNKRGLDNTGMKSTRDVHPKSMIRTDSEEQTLDRFLERPSNVNSKIHEKSLQGIENSQSMSFVESDTQLTSVVELREEIRNECHSKLREIIANHSFVGCVNRELALIQNSTELYLVNTCKLSFHLFYQLMVMKFGNVDGIKLNPPPDVKALAKLAIKSCSPPNEEEAMNGNCDDMVEYIIQVLSKHASMLDEYFSIEFDVEDVENNKMSLTAIPSLINDFVPDLDSLPQFILRLVTCVEWEDEKECFKSVMKEIARFYSIRNSSKSNFSRLQHEIDCNENECNNDMKDSIDYKYSVGNLFYLAAKKYLKPPNSCIEDKSFVQIASLPQLYKVFERC